MRTVSPTVLVLLLPGLISSVQGREAANVEPEQGKQDSLAEGASEGEAVSLKFTPQEKVKVRDFDGGMPYPKRQERMAACLGFTMHRIETHKEIFNAKVEELVKKYPAKAKSDPRSLTHITLQRWMMTCYMNVEEEVVTKAAEKLWGTAVAPADKVEDIYNEFRAESPQFQAQASPAQRKLLTDIVTEYGENWGKSPEIEGYKTPGEQDIACRGTCWVTLMAERRQKDEIGWKPGGKVGSILEMDKKEKNMMWHADYTWTEYGVEHIKNVSKQYVQYGYDDVWKACGSPEGNSTVSQEAKNILAGLSVEKDLRDSVQNGLIVLTGEGKIQSDDPELADGWMEKFHIEYNRSYWVHANDVHGQNIKWAKPLKIGHKNKDGKYEDGAEAKKRKHWLPTDKAGWMKFRKKVAVALGLLMFIAGGFAVVLILQGFAESDKKAQQDKLDKQAEKKAAKLAKKESDSTPPGSPKKRN